MQVWRLEGGDPSLVLDAVEEVDAESVGYRPDSREIAFGHTDGTVSLYDLITRKQVARLENASGRVYCLAYHPREPRLAVAAGDEVAIWDLTTRRRLLRLRHPERATAIAWHPRGHRLATACDNHQIHLWNAESGQAITSGWNGHRTGGIHLRFDPSGDRVVSSDWHWAFRLWDAATGQHLLSMPRWGMYDFQFDEKSPESGRARGREQRVSGGQEMRVLKRPTPSGSEDIRSLAIHPNVRLLSLLTRTGIALFDLLTGEELAFLSGTFNASKFDATGAFWTAGEGGLLRWRTQTVSDPPTRFRIGPPEWVADLLLNGQDSFALSADGRVVAVPRYSDGAQVIHRGASRRTLRLGPQLDVRGIDISADGRWIGTRTHWHRSTNVRSKLWETNSGRLVANLPSPEIEEVSGFSSDNRWLYVSGQQSVRLEITSLVAAPLLPEGPPATDTQWQKAWRSERMRIGGAASPESRLIAFGQKDGTIDLRSAQSDDSIATIQTPEEGGLGALTFSPDGTRLLALGNESGSLYDFDLRRIREQLAEVGLDWNLPPYPSAKPEELKPILPPRLRVELFDAEWAGTRRKMAEYESRGAAERLRSHPRDAEARFRLGDCLLRANRVEEAHEHLSTALAIRPDLDEALYPRALAALRLKRWEEADLWSSACPKKCPFESKARDVRGQARIMLKRYRGRSKTTRL